MAAPLLQSSQQDFTCFSESYAEARGKFLSAAEAIGAEIHSLQVAKDDSGDYQMDVAIIRGTGAGLLVISSGTHGVEGYAGSAIQICILRQLAERRTSFGPTVALVHAVNPYGMAHFRRFNENNVDLNRNALFPRQFEKLAREDGLRDLYARFDPLFNPPSAPTLCNAYFSYWVKTLCNVACHGTRQLKTAIVAATYTQSKGIYYGGQTLQRSHVVLRDFMTAQFSSTRADQVGWVDIHSGLGPCGVDVVMGSSRDNDELMPFIPAVAGECDGVQTLSVKKTDDIIKLRCENPQIDTSGPTNQAGGYEFTVGSLDSDEWLGQFFRPDSGRVLAVTQEFGTLPGVMVARAVMFENMAFHYDRSNHEYWRTMTRDAFYVRTPDWKARVLRRGIDVFGKILDRVVARCACHES